MSNVYFGDWKSFGGMVRDFEGIDGDEEDFGEVRPELYRNEAMWRENKEKFAEAMKADRWQGLEVLFAAYTYQDYEGDAFVLFRKDGKLYEVNGSHCSCHGLSSQSYYGDDVSQWEPEETTKEAILHRLDEGSDYGIFGTFKDQIHAAVEAA